MLAGSVPVVFAPPGPDGTPVPDYTTLAPAGSVINAADYPTPHDLARHLVYLAEHPRELAKYYHPSTSP